MVVPFVERVSESASQRVSESAKSEKWHPDWWLREKEKPAQGGLFFFFYSKFRISGWRSKSAKFVGVSWLVSGCKSGVVTSDFGPGA